MEIIVLMIFVNINIMILWLNCLCLISHPNKFLNSHHIFNLWSCKSLINVLSKRINKLLIILNSNNLYIWNYPIQICISIYIDPILYLTFFSYTILYNLSIHGMIRQSLMIHVIFWHYLYWLLLINNNITHLFRIYFGRALYLYIILFWLLWLSYHLTLFLLVYNILIWLFYNFIRFVICY